MSHFEKYFTVDEANAVLPTIRKTFTRIHELFVQLHINKSVASVSIESLPVSRTNGSDKNPEFQKKAHLSEINNLLTDITERGIIIQDVTRGLIDFPAIIQGQEVFLCYELADGERVQFYHPIDTGFGGRKPIPDSEDL
jgi:hypothetical protein